MILKHGSRFVEVFSPTIAHENHFFVCFFSSSNQNGVWNHRPTVCRRSVPRVKKAPANIICINILSGKFREGTVGIYFFLFSKGSSFAWGEGVLPSVSHFFKKKVYKLSSSSFCCLRWQRGCCFLFAYNCCLANVDLLYPALRECTVGDNTLEGNVGRRTLGTTRRC